MTDEIDEQNDAAEQPDLPHPDAAQCARSGAAALWRSHVSSDIDRPYCSIDLKPYRVFNVFDTSGKVPGIQDSVDEADLRLNFAAKRRYYCALSGGLRHSAGRKPAE